MTNFLIACVAVQYHWILNESVLYLGKSIGQAKYKQDEFNVSTCPVILNSYPFNEKFIVHTTYDSEWPVHQAVQYCCMDIGQFAIIIGNITY